MTSLESKATTFLGLHVPGDPGVFPTVWDAWSAKVAVEAGFPALTVGSHPLAESIGRGDGEGMTFEESLARVGQITAAVDVPVSVDIESGYGLEPARLIEGLLEAGAIGLNIEDTVHSEGRRLRAAQEHADLVRGLRESADKAGVHVVVNARTDLFLRKDGDDADRVDRAIERLRLAAEAGADVLFPVGRHAEADLRRLTAELPLPVSATVQPDQADKAALADQGVARITFGPYLQAALTREVNTLLDRWK
ncbi:isocitrate lyase/phosphoenolpyruvate mutase family protein [Streptomyces gardneri]|uniref:isocitrate lyase/PEP mutase family protein n=1 Tax=Nocardia TaxID=1817 RepID=UPI00135CAF74|nr:MULTISPECIES: isocitrate lyase/phosphoenolpyruvate mutase family protein [Nocardia]MBF6166653.1 isocitrate lyase/phosphoenolpyruvate mutase family protein [Streptomyces gardneri]MBF6205419.1 isocitrate lyase/phosphoenolpyruvate mutase family protein [Streptomyces gardneri]UAK34707.1 isocitrate lyase/phosphoenolpyruvate mutase family protein [Nocardia asteroides]